VKSDIVVDDVAASPVTVANVEEDSTVVASTGTLEGKNDVVVLTGTFEVDITVVVLTGALEEVSDVVVSTGTFENVVSTKTNDVSSTVVVVSF